MNWDATTVWEGFQVPAGLDRQTAIDAIVLECAELELLYPNYEYCKWAITTWTRRRLPIWEKLYATTQLDYNPIENYDRMEDWTDNGVFGSQTHNDSSGIDTSSSQSHTEGVDNINNTRSVKGFDSADFVGSDRDEGKNTTDVDSSGSGHTNRALDANGTRIDATENTRKGRAHGNIGVTTTQQMIAQERESVEFDIYMYIVNDFKEELCMSVY